MGSEVVHLNTSFARLEQNNSGVLWEARGYRSTSLFDQKSREVQKKSLVLLLTFELLYVLVAVKQLAIE